jgi:hypothetical protein
MNFTCLAASSEVCGSTVENVLDKVRAHYDDLEAGQWQKMQPGYPPAPALRGSTLE